MALVAGFVAFVVFGWPLGVLALVAGALIEVGELYLWMRFLRRYRVSTGPEGLMGERGTALEEVGDGPEPGEVRVRGELWRARSNEVVAAGEEVEVVAIDGLTLTVRPTGRLGSQPGGR